MKLKSLMRNEERLRLRHLGQNGEPLATSCLDFYGAYSLKNFSKKLKVGSGAQPSEGLSFEWKSKSFRLHCPGDIRIETDEDGVLWDGSRKSELRTSFEWKEFPKGLKLQFQNSQSASFELVPETGLVISQNVKTLGFFSTAGVIHLAAFVLIAMNVQFTQDRRLDELSKKPEVIDLSKLDIRLHQPVYQPSRSGGTYKRRSKPKALTALQRLNRNTSRSRPAFNDSVFVSKDQLAKEAFKATNQMPTNGAETWDIAFDELEFAQGMGGPMKELNISESRVAKAFQKVIPRLKECYEDVLIRDSNLSGRLDLQVDVAESGRPEAVHVYTANGTRNSSVKALESCFSRAYAKLRLPEKPNQAFSVRHSLILKSGQLAYKK